jgi:hypothetical protein
MQYVYYIPIGSNALGVYRIGSKAHKVCGNRFVFNATKQMNFPSVSVPEACSAKGCKAVVPAGLAPEHMCVLHYTLFIEQECAEMRRESNLGNTSHDRQMDFMNRIATRGETLVKVATSGFSMSDEIKARVLSTLLTLMNCRENMDRAAMRQSALRRFVG